MRKGSVEECNNSINVILFCKNMYRVTQLRIKAVQIVQALILFLNGLFSIGFIGAFSATLSLAGYNSLGDFPEKLCEDQSICLFDKSGAYAIIQLVLAICSLMLFTLKFCINKRFYSMHGWFHVFLSVGAVVFFFMRLINVGYLNWAWKDQGCKNPAADGSPFERLERYGSEIDREIKTIEQCNFNAFNQENILYSTSSVSYKIDWSDSKTYTEAQRQSLLTNANGVLSDPYNIDTLPYFYDEFYWGCSHICLKTRYDMNIAWVWLSLTVCLSEVALAVMSFWLSYIYNEPVQSTREERTGLLEVVPATPVEDVEANKTPTEDKKPDQTESEEDANKESASSPPSDATRGGDEFRLKL
tara:strand:+ start:9373 stop:10446 length:1074 start_codon:yes stop_codon:yes gene_type:complete